jgi:hypothetical protein
MSIRNRNAQQCPCSTNKRKPPRRLAGYLDSSGNYQDGTNPDPTYGGTIPAADIAPPAYAPQAGYDALGRLITPAITPATTAPALSTTWILGAALAAFVVAELFAEGQNEARRWSRK